MPAAGERSVKDLHSALGAGQCLEVPKLKWEGAETALLDVDRNIAERGKRGAHASGPLDFECDRGDDRVVWQGCVEGKDGPILLVGGIVAHVEGCVRAVLRAADFGELATFQYPAVVKTLRSKPGNSRDHSRDPNIQDSIA